MTDEILSLRNRWDHLRKYVRDTKKRMNLSIDYFMLLEEAKQWFREGSKLLVIVARKATTIKVPEEAIDLLQEIDAYIKQGEEQQERRIEKLKQLSTIIFGKSDIILYLQKKVCQTSKISMENDLFTIKYFRYRQTSAIQRGDSGKSTNARFLCSYFFRVAYSESKFTECRRSPGEDAN